MRALAVRLFGVASLCAACGSSEGDPFDGPAETAAGGTEGEGDPSEAGSGGAAGSGGRNGPAVSDEQACSSYRQQFCEYVISCGADGAAADCVAELDMFVQCRSGRLANECAEVFPDAPCRTFPAGCGLSDVADSTEAVAACDAFQHGLCEVSVACGDDYDACRALLFQELPCDTVIALAADPQPCLDALSTLGCEDELPEACLGILI